MAHTHEFDCKACGAHLDSREELDRHNRDHHPSQQASGSNFSSRSSSNRSGSGSIDNAGRSSNSNTRLE